MDEQRDDFFGQKKILSHAIFLKPPRRILIGIFFVGVIMSFAMFSPPGNFPAGSVVTIDEGMSLSQIGALLKETRVVRFSTLFESAVILRAGESGVLFGDYYFAKPESAWRIAKRLTRGAFGLESVKVTIPEGFTVKKIAVTYDDIFPEFDEQLFIKLAERDEGHLFPDTYYFLPNVHAPEIYFAMKENFKKQIAAVEDEISAFGKPLEDVIIMASLLEREARKTETRKIVAGILWKRLSIGMPLQVDAVFEYINGKNTYTLTLDDLQIDSPYNTYKYRGLPPGPIANPGLDSIVAAINPIETPYFFYLTDDEGNMHYARTHDEHVLNKARYLRK